MGSGMSGGCCASCCSCCCPSDNGVSGKDSKYPHVKYHTPSEAKASIELHEKSPGMDKLLFEFSQPRSDFGLHPQMRHSLPPMTSSHVTGMTAGHVTSSSDTESVELITDQPRLFRPHSLDEGTRESALPESIAAMNTQPTILYSLYYDIQRATLSVHLKQLFNLSLQRKHKTLDSYVTLYLLPRQVEVFESKIVRNDLNPTFDQEFEFTGQPGMQILKKQMLVFKVYGYSKYHSPDLMGVVRVKLEDSDLFGETTHRRIEENTSGVAKVEETIGDILFSLTYIPQSQCIQGTLLKAANLKPQDITGMADPYIKVSLRHKNKKVHRWKSTIKKNTLTPIYNEQFQFSIQQLDLPDVRMDFVVMDYDRFSRDDLIGVVEVGPEVECETGVAHWEEMIGAPNQTVSRWHPIIPQLTDQD